MKICPDCQKEFNDKEKFCSDCGVELKIKPVFCTKCGGKIEEGQEICPHCGAKIEKKFSTELVGKAANKIGKVVSDKAGEILSEENISSIRSHARDAVDTIRDINSNSGQNVISKIKSTSLPIIAIITVAFLFIGYNIYGYYSSPEKQVEAIVNKHMECLLQAYEGDLNAVDEMIELFTPEIQDKIIAMHHAAGLARQREENVTEFKEQFRDRIKMLDDQLKIRFGFSMKDLVKEYHIEDLQIQGNTARLIVHCDTKANIEATGMSRNNKMQLKKIDGKWRIEYLEGFFFN